MLQRECDYAASGETAWQCHKQQHGLGKSPLQAKLILSSPGDEYEQEADRIADKVMRMPESELVSPVRPNVKAPRRQADEDLERRAQGREQDGEVLAIDNEVETRIRALSGGGSPLPERERAFFEERIGLDLRGVRVHSDAKAAEAARSVSARAFTMGRDVVFASGEYAPGTTEGRRLIAHELGHVVQQSQGQAASITQCKKASSPDPVRAATVIVPWTDDDGEFYRRLVEAIARAPDFRDVGEEPLWQPLFGHAHRLHRELSGAPHNNVAVDVLARFEPGIDTVAHLTELKRHGIRSVGSTEVPQTPATQTGGLIERYRGRACGATPGRVALAEELGEYGLTGTEYAVKAFELLDLIDKVVLGVCLLVESIALEISGALLTVVAPLGLAVLGPIQGRKEMVRAYTLWGIELACDAASKYVTTVEATGEVFPLKVEAIRPFFDPDGEMLFHATSQLGSSASALFEECLTRVVTHLNDEIRQATCVYFVELSTRPHAESLGAQDLLALDRMVHRRALEEAARRGRDQAYALRRRRLAEAFPASGKKI